MATEYGRMYRDGKRWVLENLPPHVAIRLKSMFARIPKTQTGTFNLPATNDMSADLEWFIDRYPMEMTDLDRGMLAASSAQFFTDRAAIEAILLPGYRGAPSSIFKPHIEIYEMQQQASAMTVAMKRLLLGDDVGLGKTFVALDALGRPETLPAAIVVPAHLPNQWVNKYIIPHTYYRAHIIDGTSPYDLPEADLYLFRYSNIHGWVDIAGEGIFKGVAFDEIHNLRTGESTAKGAAALVFSQNAALRIGMSATPVFNYGAEIWNIMQCIDPDVLGPWGEFLIEWCRSGPGGKWLVKDPDALGSYLREAKAFLRRVRQGRPINRLVIEVGYDDEVAAKSEDLARMLAQRVMSGSFLDAGKASRELDALARQVTGVAKARSVAAYVRMLLDSGLKVVLAGWHREVYEIWKKELAAYRPVFYTGSETGKQKDKAADDFIKGRTNLFIISLRSGEGVDGLQAVCYHVVVGELDWSPQVYEQLFGRLDRPGQPEPQITAHFLYSEGGSDPVVMSTNAVKRDQARGISDPGIILPQAYVDESHIKKLAQSYLEKETL